MTTIVYDKVNGVIAADGRVTSDGIIMTDCDTKIEVIDGECYAGSGASPDIRNLTEIAAGKRSPNDGESLEANMIFTKDEKVFMCACENGKLGFWELTYDDAIGSGREFALAALDFECSAVDAVAYAATKDIYSGGEITSFKVSTKTLTS